MDNNLGCLGGPASSGHTQLVLAGFGLHDLAILSLRVLAIFGLLVLASLVLLNRSSTPGPDTEVVPVPSHGAQWASSLLPYDAKLSDYSLVVAYKK
ncbi:hypothetical protein C8A01DRAFT_41734 [Parachaetomium inaequale]|uniref:Uncharacterized protein n=1 Tax=Parachaetomium inaequale TaxID=2588326 RepID=A0AAN6P9A1_9PEZI|nr:hypothetical protein C8A01DRAFT_41734 [Parachaetomium inaequale]